MVQNILLLSFPLIGGKPVRLINDVSPKLPPVLGDANRLEQILLNLIGNAIKFTGEGQVTVTAKKRKKMVEITVSDTGEGIAAADQARIFQQFEQADSSLSRKHDGAGLGLAITRQLIGMHGGTIRVESKPGVGSHFIFTLPLLSEPFLESDNVAEETSDVAASFPDFLPVEVEVKQDENFNWKSQKTTFHLLIVDDNPINLAVLENQLLAEGYRISKASNGLETLEMVSRDRPDLILLDLMMPDMDGFQVCREIRKSHKKSELPIIYLVARKQEATLLEGLSQGGNDYMTKPFSQNMLLARIRTQLNTLTTRKRFVTSHQFSEKIATFRTMSQLAVFLVKTLTEDPFIQSVLLTQQGKVLKSEGVMGDIELPLVDRMEDFQIIEGESGAIHMKLKDQLLVSVVHDDPKLKEWLETVVAQIKKSVENWRNLAYDPMVTPTLSLIGSLLKELLFIKSEGNYCHLHTFDEVKEVRISMKRVLLTFPDLMQVHRSYLINTKAPTKLIKKQSSWAVQLYDHEIPVGRSWLADAQDRLSGTS